MTTITSTAIIDWPKHIKHIPTHGHTNKTNEKKNSIYDAGNQICKHCHEECLGECFGPGPSNCSVCRHVRDGPFCVKECPVSKYNDKSECKPCHENCVSGCTGPNNYLGRGGCNSCEKAIVSMYDPNVVEQCLKAEESCPSGYYHEYISPQEEGALKSLTGKSVCRKCHQRCKSCTAYGIHVSVCECLKYSSPEQCEDQCPITQYADEETHRCVKCSEECRGCRGPNNNNCIACRNYRVWVDGPEVPAGKRRFNCTASCPPDKQWKIFDSEDPYCSDRDPTEERATDVSDDQRTTAIVGGLVICLFFFGIFAIALYLWFQRTKSKENVMRLTMKMTGFEDNEPLKVTNIKPNLNKLRIVKEQNLRRGGVLGIGAFGTVYKGVWIPEGEKVKIPVAIKVLREGSQPSMNQQLCEEAYIMASVDHPNLLKLLAVCMTSQLMLVTQLMPLGCLLDYVRTNRLKIGSKPMLNWSAQIARGMAYLEERRMVHRDLALRNVLLQTPGCLKITDFGLAKLLDINEDEYKAANGKVPIKWLAPECIMHRIFTHKSDVWAFGVTLWELMTYGEKPYEKQGFRAKDVKSVLEFLLNGDRLEQPTICSLEVYMEMFKCWIKEPESRPSFKDLAEQFSKFACDPGRYLAIPGDRFLRLPTYTQQDERQLIQMLAVPTEGEEKVVDAEEYLHPQMDPSLQGTPPPPTPIKKFMQDRGFEGEPVTYYSSDPSAVFLAGCDSTDGRIFMPFQQQQQHQQQMQQQQQLQMQQMQMMPQDLYNSSFQYVNQHLFPQYQIPPQYPGSEAGVSMQVDDDDYLVPNHAGPRFDNIEYHLMSRGEYGPMMPPMPPQTMQAMNPHAPPETHPLKRVYYH